MIQVVDLGFRR